MKKTLGDVDKPLFFITISIIVTACIITMLFTESVTEICNYLKAAVFNSFGWFYNLSVVYIFLFCLYFAFSKIGGLKLGKPGEKPEFSTFTWVAMLFSAGIGVGYIFWGVAEPMTHYMNTPYFAEPGTPEAMAQGLAITFFHDGFNPWLLYTGVAVSIAYAAYRFDQPLFYVSGYYGLLGEKIHGNVGRVLNCITIFVTVVGISTSLGIGTMSVSFAMEHLLNIPNTTTSNIIVLIVAGAVSLLSTSKGISKGMAKLSNMNIGVCLGLLLYIFICGPTGFILKMICDSFGLYMEHLPFMMFWTDAAGTTNGWPAAWTMFFWAWWYSWVGFIAGFVARISKGRTIRELIIVSTSLAVLMTILWYGIVGSTGIDMYQNGKTALWEAIKANYESGYFMMLEELPFSTIISVIAFISLILFMSTSVDAASNYVGIMLSKGKKEPSVAMKLLCGIMIIALPMSLLNSGGLNALQTVTCIFALPMAIITLFIPISILSMIKHDPNAKAEWRANYLQETFTNWQEPKPIEPIKIFKNKKSN